MITLSNTYNYSGLLSLMYFINYSIPFILFFLVINNYFKSSSNIFAVTYYVRYSKKNYLFYITAFVSLLGIPPFNLFAPKFAALSSVWVLGGSILFFFSMATIFISFALYLQVFDILFKPKIAASLTDMHVVTAEAGNQILNPFTQTKYRVYLSVFCVTGFLVFRDFFFIVSLFV